MATRAIRRYSSSSLKKATMCTSPQDFIDLEKKFSANNYSPLPKVLQRGEGMYVWDVEDKRYLDFLSAYSAVNQGHCHPRITKVIYAEQSRVMQSRAL